MKVIRAPTTELDDLRAGYAPGLRSSRLTLIGGVGRL